MLILYVVFFLIWVKVNYNKHGLNVSTFLLCLFLISSICSIFLLYFYDTYDVNRINTTAVFVHIFCYWLFFLPVIHFGNKTIQNLNLPQSNYLKPIFFIIILFSACTFISAIPKIGNAFAYSDLAEARKLHNLGELNEEENSGIIGYLGGIGPNLSFYALFFSFWLYSSKKKIGLLVLLLFISSFAIVFHNIAIMGRDGIVRWIFFFIFNFILFKDTFTKEFKLKLFRLSIIPSLVLIYIFYLISSARFGEKVGVVYSFLDYLGQQNIYFSYGFDQFIDGVAGGKINFSYFLGERVSLNNLNEFVYADYHLNTFSSFVGSIYFDVGLFSTILIAICVFAVLTLYNLFGGNNIIKLFIYLIFFEIYMLGLFYYMFYGPTKVNTLLMLVCLGFISNFISKSKLN